MVTEASYITNCYATGNITAYSQASWAVGGGLIGFIVGSSLDELLSLTDCYATGNIATWGGIGAEVGGFTGDMYACVKATNCYATGNITDTAVGSRQKYAGGFTGNIRYSEAYNCYSTGSVEVGGLPDTAIAGGFCANSSPTSLISNCYSAGSTSAEGTALNAGGFIGQVVSGVTIRDCYYLYNAYSADTSGYGSNAGTITSLTGLTTSQLDGSAAIDATYSTGTCPYSGDTILTALNTVAETNSYAPWMAESGNNSGYPVFVRGTGYFVTFMSEGSVYTIVGAADGDTVSAPTGLTRTGYALEGWYTENIFVNKVSFPYTVTADATLYANWVAAYTVTIHTTTDGSPASAPGTVELWKDGSKSATAAGTGTTGEYSASVGNGTYDIYIDGKDTGTNVTVSGAATGATVDHYTVTYAVTDAGAASGSTVSAMAGGISISSGTAVPTGKAVVISATGAGASVYTYLWSGAGTSGETSMTLTVAALSETIDASCVVTGVSLPPSTGDGAEIIVNGISHLAGTSQTTTNSDGQTVTVVTVDSDKLEDILESEENGAVVTIPYSGGSDAVSGVLTGEMVKNMEDRNATLTVQTDSVIYTFLMEEINIDAVAQQFSVGVSLADITVTITISAPSDETVAVVENAAEEGGFSIVIPAVDFMISCAYGRAVVEVESFSAYVERLIAIPDGIDPEKITTGVVVKPDGTTYHVPTQIVVINGVYYAKINSLTNSTYAVVWHPVTFSDAENHWAKDAINNMGSRMIVYGVDGVNFAPDENMTRAEFAAVIVRSLGLNPGVGENSYDDIGATAWYSAYVETATSYGIINGYDDGTFRPDDLITREQAMTMLARAMKLTGLEAGLTEGEADT
jgi:uncharacterized repeat protein (TIGR02543 family)